MHVPPAIHLGINTCFAVKRWPETERWMSIIADDLGLQQCQVSLDLFEPGLDPVMATGTAQAVSKAAATAGVTLHSTFTGLAGYSGNLLLHPAPEARRAALQWFERAIDLTGEMGAAGTGGFLGALSVADAADPVQRHMRTGELKAAMDHLSDYASRVGLSFLLFENMAVPRELGSCIPEAHQLEAMGSEGPVPWTLCLDLGHPCALNTGSPSDDPLHWLSEDWMRTPVLQIQQANRAGDFHWPFTPERNAEGLLFPAAVIESLQANIPDGDLYLFFEIIHPAEYPDDGVLSDLRQSVDCWNTAIEQAAVAPNSGVTSG